MFTWSFKIIKMDFIFRCLRVFNIKIYLFNCTLNVNLQRKYTYFYVCVLKYLMYSCKYLP